MKLLILTILFIFQITTQNTHLKLKISKTSKTKLILISIDGCRWDYLEKFKNTHQFPILNAIKSNGVSIKSEKGQTAFFPTLTFPNHYSQITGLHPGSSGILGNNMYDPVWNTYFSMGNPESLKPKWWGGEPIWNTLEKNNIKTACIYWPGSEVPIQNLRPSYWNPWSYTVTDKEKMDKALEYIDKRTEDQPEMISMYFTGIDTAGHRHGPDSLIVGDELEKLDTLIGYFQRELAKRGENPNIIITADHGMTSLSPSRRVYLDDFLETHDDSIRFYNFGQFDTRILDNQMVVLIQPKNSTVKKTVLKALKDVRHMKVFSKSRTPKRWHFRKNRRVADIVAVAELGWVLSSRQFNRSMRNYKGGHGYDNAELDMKGLFLATGPSFKSGFVSQESIHSVHLYELMTHLFGVKSSANEGSFRSIKFLLKKNWENFKLK